MENCLLLFKEMSSNTLKSPVNGLKSKVTQFISQKNSKSSNLRGWNYETIIITSADSFPNILLVDQMLIHWSSERYDVITVA